MRDGSRSGPWRPRALRPARSRRGRGRGRTASSTFRMPRARSPSTGTTTIRAGSVRRGPPGPAPSRWPAAPRRVRTPTHACSGATAICTSCSTRPMRTSRPARTRSACASPAAESSTASRSRPAESFATRRGTLAARCLRGEAAPTCRARLTGRPTRPATSTKSGASRWPCRSRPWACAGKRVRARASRSRGATRRPAERESAVGGARRSDDGEPGRLVIE